jgi:hypothetical protein
VARLAAGMGASQATVHASLLPVACQLEKQYWSVICIAIQKQRSLTYLQLKVYHGVLT